MWTRTSAREVREALEAIGWIEVASSPGPPPYRRLRRKGADYIFPWDDTTLLDPHLLKRIGTATGLTPSDL